MHKELTDAGHTVSFLAVNQINADSSQDQLVAVCDFPLFQDVVDVDAWGLHGGNKDDFYLYGTDGLLAAYLPMTGGAVGTNLSSSDDYAGLKALILELIP